MSYRDNFVETSIKGPCSAQHVLSKGKPVDIASVESVAQFPQERFARVDIRFTQADGQVLLLQMTPEDALKLQRVAREAAYECRGVDRPPVTARPAKPATRAAIDRLPADVASYYHGKGKAGQVYAVDQIGDTITVVLSGGEGDDLWRRTGKNAPWKRVIPR